MRETLGFIGLGVMGAPMCANLVRKSGFSVVGWDPRAEAVAQLEAVGLQPGAGLEDVAARADTIFLSLPSIVEVEEVCLGADGLARAGGRVRTIVDTSTSDVNRTRALAAELKRRGIVFLDAPIARMRQAAQDGTLSIMVGGDKPDVERVRPLLSCMGSDITHCGSSGSGQVAKILNNMIVFMTVHALAEALTIGRSAGIDGGVLFDVMSKGSADSFALRTPGLKALVPDSFPENVFPTDYAIKDIRLALDLAADHGVHAEMASRTRDILEKTSNAGFSKEYYPVLIRLIEDPSATSENQRAD